VYKPPDYEKVEREQWRRAQEEVAKEARSPTARLLGRVATFISRFGYPKKAVLEKIREDSMFAAHFAKEPRRTGLHEAVAAKWIKALPYVQEFQILSKGGANAVKVTSDGNLETGSKGKTLPGKSLDFRWTTGDTAFYAMHKYTKQGGGNQDSQYQEMIELMKRFHHCRDTGVVLVVIVDGEYYQEKDAARLSELQRHQRTIAPKSYALSIGELPGVLEEYSGAEEAE